MASVKLQEDVTIIDIEQLARADVERLAMATLTSSTPGALREKVMLGGKQCQAGGRLCSIVVTGGAAGAMQSSFPLIPPICGFLWAREQMPIQLSLIFWRPRDSQALERAWRSLNHCKGSLRAMRPSVQWFFLHLIADRRNRILRDGNLFAGTSHRP